MHRKTAVLVGALALILAAPQAHAAAGEFTINLNGGIATPISDYKDAAKLGFMGGVGFDYMATENLGVGIDGSFISNKGSDELNTLLSGGPPDGAGVPAEAKFTLLQGGAHLKYLFPMAAESSISPYVIGGLGIYNVKGKVESSNTAFNDAYEGSESKFGLRGGLGLMYKTSEKVGVGVEGAFHWINTKEDATATSPATTATQFIGIQVGVSIGMGTPTQ